MKKKILFIYPTMIIGGSTTALLSLLNSLDPDKYEIDLQLFRNEGPLMSAIPEHVNLLPEAEKYKGTRGYIIKLSKFLMKGYVFRYLWKKLKKGNTYAVLAHFQSKELSHKNETLYDYAIGGLESWPDWYLAFGVSAKKKYGWLHSTYANITAEPDSELPWMERVDKLAFVTDDCRDAFAEALPPMAHKAITVENITDSRIILNRSRQVDEADRAYRVFVESDAFKIVTVCRLTIQVKGLDRIVNAAKILKNKGYDFLWYIIGDGEESAQLQTMIDDANIGDCLVAIGKRMNPYPFIAAADIMCMPSRYEGKPITVTESMILGTPPVVAEYLSAHQQIKAGEEGLVLPNHNETIVEDMVACLSNREQFVEFEKNLKMREYGNTDSINYIEEVLFN